MRKQVLGLALFASVAVHVNLTGCATRLGPRTIPAARFDYNDRIARSQNDQLLLNLVRLRYRDTPVFLDVGSVIAQYSLSARAGLGPRINPDGAGRPELGLDLGGAYSEQPTITYEPLQGAEFTRRLLTPVAPLTIILLAESGWSIERLLLCCAESINGIQNAPAASGPTPTRMPDNAEFRELARLLRSVQAEGSLDFHVAVDEELRKVLVRLDRPEDGAPNAETLRRVRQLLGLSDERDTFELVAKGFQQHPDEVVLAGRSLLGVLFFLSHSVRAPSSHVDSGFVTVTQGRGGEGAAWDEVTGGILKVESGLSPQKDAFVQIRYRDHWFSIQDSDLESKATFNLLTYLFSLQAASDEGPSPLLTVPVGK